MEHDLFLDRSSVEDFECQICLLVVKDPVVEHMDCAKLFCQPCFESLPNHRCPNCRGRTTDRVRAMNPIVRDKVYNKLMMKCSFEGCSDTYQLSQHEIHQTTCIHRPVACEYCQELTFPSQLEAHHKNICQLFPVHCYVPGCEIQIPRSQLDRHCKKQWKEHNELFLKRITKQDKRIKELKAEVSTYKSSAKAQTAAVAAVTNAVVVESQQADISGGLLAIDDMPKESNNDIRESLDETIDIYSSKKRKLYREIDLTNECDVLLPTTTSIPMSDVAMGSDVMISDRNAAISESSDINTWNTNQVHSTVDDMPDLRRDYLLLDDNENVNLEVKDAEDGVYFDDGSFMSFCERK